MAEDLLLCQRRLRICFPDSKTGHFLSLSYVPSESKLADEPSRIYSDSDCLLSPSKWSLGNSTFGLHTHDMIAIPSNVMKDSSGQSLTFFSPHPVPGTSRVDAFAQSISPLKNYYVFPPFVLIRPLLRFFRYWWPVLNSFCIDRLPQMEAQVPRLWKPAVCCASCRYPNDFDFQFCQKCGFVRHPLEPFAPPPLADVDGDWVSERLSALKASRDAKPYQQQKSSLQRQIQSYLWSMPSKKSLNLASPNDVISFLVWFDKFRKTVFHLNSCSVKVSCNCPRMLAARTINNNIGKLRTIFKEVGRESF